MGVGKCTGLVLSIDLSKVHARLMGLTLLGVRDEADATESERQLKDRRPLALKFFRWAGHLAEGVCHSFAQRHSMPGPHFYCFRQR